MEVPFKLPLRVEENCAVCILDADNHCIAAGMLRRDAEALVALVNANAGLVQSGVRCHDCGGINPVWFAPNGVWNQVVPERTGTLCPNCFIARAEKAGLYNATAWKLEPEFNANAGVLETADELAEMVLKYSQCRVHVESVVEAAKRYQEMRKG